LHDDILPHQTGILAVPSSTLADANERHDWRI
jgi:hypothetical protein